MKLAISYAKKVGLETLPNPRVGAVIVKRNIVIGAGSTQAYGLLHAEAVALKQASNNAKGAVMYCTLEPCCGTWVGKQQPSCVEKIVAAGIKEVCIACLDNNPKIKGKGVDFLKKKGVKVTVLQNFDDCMYTDLDAKNIVYKLRVLNEVFEHLQYNATLPFVHLKIAQSLDARMTGLHNSRIKITDIESQKLVHRMRRSHQAIVTGIKTIILDNPQLNVRHARGKNPAIVVLDSDLEIPYNSRIFDKINRHTIGETQHSILIFTSDIGYKNTSKLIRLGLLGAKVVRVPSYTEGKYPRLRLDKILEYLIQNGVYSLMIESGPTLSAAFLQAGFVAKISCFIAPGIIGMGRGIGDYLSKYQSDDSLFLSNNNDTSLLYRSESKRIPYGKDILISGYTYDIF